MTNLDDYIQDLGLHFLGEFTNIVTDVGDKVPGVDLYLAAV